MTTRYKLPDGSEIASLDVNGSMSVDKAWVTHPTLGSILIDRDKLTEVSPPEPPVGTVFSNGLNAITRCDPGTPGRPGDWYTTGDDSGPLGWETVALLVSQPSWRRYVPDPADDAPALPFAIHGDNGETAFRVTVWPSLEHPRTGSVTVLGNVSELSPAELKAAAAAMWRAAREVEQR